MEESEVHYGKRNTDAAGHRVDSSIKARIRTCKITAQDNDYAGVIVFNRELRAVRTVTSYSESEDGAMYFMLDNYDSFVYNLSAYFRELGQEILVKREYEITLSEIEALCPEGILLSPGPGKPSDAAASLQILERWKGKVPILGVCLGHQAVGHYFGAQVKKGERPMHGKLTQIYHRGEGLFTGLPQGFRVTRYHSLVVDGVDLPGELTVDAVSDEGVIMGISHRVYPVYGVQFHPEAVLTECGLELLENFITICREWREEHAYHQSA